MHRDKEQHLCIEKNGRKALEMVQAWEISTSYKVLDKQGKMFYKVWLDLIAESWT